MKKPKPPVPAAPKPKPLSPEMACRMLKALDKLYNEMPSADLPSDDYDRIKSAVMARVREYGK